MRTPHPRSARPSSRLISLGERRPEELDTLAERARYGPNRHHKRKMFDGCAGSARLDKTLCDGAWANTQQKSEALLREGIRRGMISEQTHNAWPQNVWAVDQQNEVYQANLTNSGTGEYHGFPIRGEGSFLSLIRSEWAVRFR